LFNLGSHEEKKVQLSSFFYSTYWQKNYLKTVEESRKNLPYTVGVTQFSDLTQQEFKSNYLG